MEIYKVYTFTKNYHSGMTSTTSSGMDCKKSDNQWSLWDDAYNMIWTYFLLSL